MTTNTGQRYDIWVDNCHNAANFCVLHPPPDARLAGIVSCGGDDALTDQAWHTFNWVLHDSVDDKGGWEICIYNWGQSCCWHEQLTADQTKASGFVPNIVDGEGRACARAACGYPHGTDSIRAYPSGTLAQIADDWACVRKTAGIAANEPNVPRPGWGRGESELLENCQSCCDDYAKRWSAAEWGEAKCGVFEQTCRALCDFQYGDCELPR